MTGFGLFLQRFTALVYKRNLMRTRTWMSMLISVVISLFLTWFCVDRSMLQDYALSQPKLLISPESFPQAHVAVSSDNASVSSILHDLVENKSYNTIPYGTDFNQYMEEKINGSLVEYTRQLMAGFRVNGSQLLGAYSVYYIHSPGLVLNMIANILLRLVSPSSSVTLYNHPLALKTDLDICELSDLSRIQVLGFPAVISFLSAALSVLGMSFISFPLEERVTNAKRLQLMTGVSPCLYWFTTFLMDYAFFLAIAVLQVGLFCIFQVHGIYTSSGYMGTLFALFALYGVSALAFAYFLSLLVDSTGKASVIFLILSSLVGLIGAMALSILNKLYTDYVFYIYIMGFIPAFSVTYASVQLLSVMYIDGTCIQCGKDCNFEDPFNFMDAGPLAEHPYGMYDFVIFLVVDAVLYLGLVLLIDHGVFQKMKFFVSKLWISLEYSALDEEDKDVQLEKERAYSAQISREYRVNSSSAMFVNSLGKKYNSNMTAVYGVSFQVKRGECFGLLGVNGAGKTTTFKMLTGQEIPNRGDAAVGDCSLRREKAKFVTRVGYCPQFDAINYLLTAKEILYIYALLRGIPSSHCHAEVYRWVQIMGLNEYADRPCGTYSGGNKRKLSTAMAFIGEPPVVFLDEPTSGVDPSSRRLLWDVIAKCQRAGQAIVLTSHSMEECEALCSRLTIMVGGRMKCIGSATYLKHKFGQGFTVKLKLNLALAQKQTMRSATDDVKRDVKKHFHKAEIKDEHLSLLHYHIPDPTIPLSRLFSVLEQMKRTHPVIEDYVVSDTTLEEVFMSFARKSS